MSTDYEFPATRDLVFPDRCVCCGKPKEAEIPMKINRLVPEKQNQVNRSVTLQVPLCSRCKRTDQRVLLLSLLSFALGLAGIGIACFLLLSFWDHKLGIMASLGADTIPGIPGAGVLIIVFVSIIVGFGGGFLLEAIIKTLFIPFMGKALYYAPTLAAQLLGDVEYTAGLQARLSKDAKTLHLRFFNGAVGDDFGKLNS